MALVKIEKDIKDPYFYTNPDYTWCGRNRQAIIDAKISSFGRRNGRFKLLVLFIHPLEDDGSGAEVGGYAGPALDLQAAVVVVDFGLHLLAFGSRLWYVAVCHVTFLPEAILDIEARIVFVERQLKVRAVMTVHGVGK